LPPPIQKPVLAATLAPPPEVSPRGLTRAIFEDESGEDTYSSTVSYGGRHFYIREMDNAQYDAYQSAERKGAKEMQAMAKQADVDADEAIEKADAFTDGQIALYTGVVNTCIVDWTGSRAYSEQAKSRLTVSTKAALTQLIVQKSRLGRAESDFSSRR
jgi:hypothetical protein